ncbi:MAG: DUF1501 domain-containing protein, partial [Pirellulales bacterium]|nr:DUF1501 domain-containing protein [Pirellulales bacterium]
MFDVGSFQARTCSGVSRRSFLRLGSSLPLALGLGSSVEPALAAATARAKSVVFVFLWGAPSHLDTCDPKPTAPAEYRGPFGVIPTRTPGVHFSELIPQVAQRSHLYTLIRSHATTAPGHPDAGTVALTGFEENPKPVQPNFGSIVARHRGRVGNLPPFISIARGTVMDGARRIEGYGGGTLGQLYDPFLAGASELGEVEIPALQLLDGLVPNRIDDRRRLSRQLDAVPRTLALSGFDRWNQTYQSAYKLLMDSRSRQAFDLTRESPQTRERYGQSVFGQSSLL